MSEINLLKNELQGSGPMSFGPKGLASLYVILGVLALEFLAYGGLWGYQKKVESNARNWERQAADVDLEIERHNAERKEVVSFQRRLNNIQVVLDRHVFWSSAFNELQKYTLKTVQLTTLQVNQTDGVFVVTGTVPTYTELGKYLQGLRQSPNILEVNLKTSGQSQGAAAGYDFNAEIRFNTKLLQKP